MWPQNCTLIIVQKYMHVSSESNLHFHNLFKIRRKTIRVIVMCFTTVLVRPYFENWKFNGNVLMRNRYCFTAYVTSNPAKIVPLYKSEHLLETSITLIILIASILAIYLVNCCCNKMCKLLDRLPSFGRQIVRLTSVKCHRK